MLNPTQKSRRGKLLRFPVHKAAPRDYGARWVDQDGAELGVTNGATVCLLPRNPHRLRISNGQFDHVVRCGVCPGCLELDIRRLAERFRRAYEKHDGRLFLVLFKAEIPNQNRIARNARRWRGVHVESQLVRLGPGWAGLLTRDPRNLEQELRARNVESRTEPIRLKRGRRAFRRVASGLAIARAHYGKNINRYYGRGLPPVDKQSWSVNRVQKYEHYNRATSPRAWTDDGRRLLPPSSWANNVIELNAVRRVMEAPRSVDAYFAIEPRIRELVQKIAKPMNVIAVPKTPEELERQRAFNLRMLRGTTAMTNDADSRSETIPPFIGGELQKFSPKEGERPPPEPVDGQWIKTQDGRTIHWTEREKEDEKTREASRARSDEILARSKAQDWESFRKRVAERMKRDP